MSELDPTRYVMHFRGVSSHRKIRRLARLLKVNRFEAYGLAGAVWDWVDEHRPDGDLTGLDAEGIVDSIGAGDYHDPETLVAAWVNVGLLDQDEDGRLAIHGWTDEGRSGAKHEDRVRFARMGAHVRHHVKAGSPKPDTCEYCRDVQGIAPPDVPALAAPEAESLSPDSDVRALAATEMQQLAPSEMPYEDEDVNGDRDPKTSPKRRRAPSLENERGPAWAPDDPERPFADVGGEHG